MSMLAMHLKRITKMLVGHQQHREDMTNYVAKDD